MRAAYFLHIGAGSVGLLSGYAALVVMKGGPPHRRIGMVFVWSMLTMTLFGMAMAAASGGPWGWLNFRAALLTAYLVVTGLTTLRPHFRGAEWLALGGMLLAVITGCVSLVFGLEAVAAGGSREGVPAFPFFLFALVGLLGGLGDYRLRRAGGLRGTRRLARHLWRMCFALLVAAMSFFFGQAKVIPMPLRRPLLLSLPVLTVVAAMLYWLWRVRVRRSTRGIAALGTVEAT